MTARETLTLVRAVPQLEIRRLSHETDAVYEKRCAAIRALGTRWLRHPSYVFQPRHSTDPLIWGAEWEKLVADIARRAALDRGRRVAFQRAEAMRKTLNEWAS